MKKIKRILITSLICVFAISLFVFSTKKVNATKSDNGKGNWTPTETITQNVLGMEHLSVYGNANDTKPQHINVLLLKIMKKNIQVGLLLVKLMLTNILLDMGQILAQVLHTLLHKHIIH